jgi:hypothetical protein
VIPRYLSLSALLPFTLAACGDDADVPDAGPSSSDASAAHQDDAGTPSIYVDDAGMVIVGNGDGDGDGDAADADGGGRGEDDAGAVATCAFTGEQAHESLGAQHVAEPLPASAYNSSPPSSGPHCNAWGRYAIFGEDAPLPACNFIHNLEHGAVVLLYNCPSACPELIEELSALQRSLLLDPDCFPARVVLTPYAEMDSLVAASAWGYTWTSDCYDDAARTSLVDFITAHLGSSGQAPEASVCGHGSIAP